MSIVDLLEGKVINQHFEIISDLSTLKENGCILGFYFASSWYEPCLAFTQLLISFYDDMLMKYEKKKTFKGTTKFEIIFVSSDLDEESFMESVKEMPWKAISYHNCQLRKKISKKYEVKEIPSLVLVEGWSGKTINTKGRDALSKDIIGDEFPWRRSSLFEILGTEFKVGGKIKDCSAELKSSYIGVYFSAYWCPPCRLLTTHLIDVYNKLKNNSKHKFEVIFISSDRSLDSYNEYSNMMPWLCLPYQDPRTKSITSYFDVQAIPALILLNPSHQIISPNARSAVFNDPEGQFFPWTSEQPEELTEASIEYLQTAPCLILFTEGKEDIIQKARSLLEESTSSYHSECSSSRDGLNPLPPIKVFYEGSQSDEVADSVRSFAQIEGREPLAVMVEGDKVLRGEENKLDVKDIEELLNKFKEQCLDDLG